jgi:DNA-binding winged helix-turn-helix (wHTH) protein
MPIVAKQRVRFGPFELDTRARELYKRGLKLKLQGHPIQILAMLLERPGDLITREEIQQKLWPTESETFVDFEHGLNTAVRKLRQVLGDEAETPQYIETLPRRGYRFVGAITVEEADPKPVEVAAGVNASMTAAAEKQPHRKRLLMRPLLVLLLVAALIAVGLFLFRFARRVPGRLVVTETRQLTYMGDAFGRILTDGRRIYFESHGKEPLRYVSVNGGEAVPISSPVSRWPQALHISHDGAYLLVKDLYGPRGGFEAPIWLVDVNSGAARKLGDVEAQDAAFAPDGKTIVVAKDRELYLTDIQGANPVKLTEATGMIFRPRWSPDGQRLRFHVWDGTFANLSLWELGRDRALHPLFKGWKKPSYVCCGEWTADGRYYLFKGDGKYWSVSESPGSTPSEPTLLTTMGNSVVTAMPSPSEDTIYVNVEQGSGTNVFRWDIDPSHSPSILYQDLKAVTLVFSRDGQWIAYSHKTSTGHELWRARADGSDKLQLTTPFS